MTTVYLTRHIWAALSILRKRMRARALRRTLQALGCVEVRQVGSHLRVECRTCRTTIPVHAGQELGPGLLRAIERDLEPCLGKGWLRKA